MFNGLQIMFFQNKKWSSGYVYSTFLPYYILTKCIGIQQVPEEIERVMVGIQAYLSIRKQASDTGLSFFEDDDESGKDLADKVCFPCFNFLTRCNFF